MDREEIEKLIKKHETRAMNAATDWKIDHKRTVDWKTAAALRHLLQAQTWRPIEDEAKDGSSILTYPHFRVTSYNRCLAEGMDGFTRWSDEVDGCVLLRPQPTHWMRLPQPPDLFEERASATPSERHEDSSHDTKSKLEEAKEIIRTTPVLKIDVKVARARGEAEAIEYTKNLIDWDARARSFLKGNGNG